MMRLSFQLHLLPFFLISITNSLISPQRQLSSEFISSLSLSSIDINHDKFENAQIGDQKVSKLGIGTWAWGDKFFWKYNTSQDDSLKSVFQASIENGVNFFDTAEIYGNGKSELLIGRFLRDTYNNNPSLSVAVATKFAPLPLRQGSQAVVESCKDSLDRLGISQISLYQIHWPWVWQNEAYWEGLAECYHQGLVKSVGVSNYGENQMVSAYKLLKSRGVPLASNQIQYSLLCRTPEYNGVMRTAKELGISILAYSPLAQGILTGKFNDKNLPSGPRSAVTRLILPRVKGLLSEMTQIADVRGKSLPQIALNWCIEKGTIPIPGARTLPQVLDNCGALGWSLDQEEIARLDLSARESGVNIPNFLQGN